MTDKIPSEDIEQIVGVPRHATAHYGRALPAEQTLYILHSHACINSGIDLRQCPFSLALDVGAPIDVWEEHENQPVELAITEHCGQLIPAALLDDVRMKVYVVVLTQIEWAEVDQVFANKDDADARAKAINDAIYKFDHADDGKWEAYDAARKACQAELEPVIGKELAERLNQFEDARVEERDLL